MGVPNDSGCALRIDDENANIEIGKSISLPVSVIDIGKVSFIFDRKFCLCSSFLSDELFLVTES